MVSSRPTGCYTAIVTPMVGDGAIDKEGLRRLVDFQETSGIDGIVAVGTTGENPTLSPGERLAVVQRCREWLEDAVDVVAGTGTNSTEEAIRATGAASDSGVERVLVVDPYYNAPSSPEIRREYYDPIARAFPNIGIIPYVVPSRTGTRLEPPDLARLAEECPNVVGVKDATGSVDYGREVRGLLGPEFSILSGDDGRAAGLIRDPAVHAQGLISVVSNVFPRTLAAYVRELRAGDTLPDALARRVRALTPLLSLVTVETQERTPKGEVRVRARNPVPVKAIMNILGIPAGRCRPPLGRLTPSALDVVLGALRRAHEECPELFAEVESAFDVTVSERLRDPRSWEGLSYD